VCLNGATLFHGAGLQARSAHHPLIPNEQTGSQGSNHMHPFASLEGGANPTLCKSFLAQPAHPKPK